MNAETTTGYRVRARRGARLVYLCECGGDYGTRDSRATMWPERSVAVAALRRARELFRWEWRLVRVVRKRRTPPLTPEQRAAVEAWREFPASHQASVIAINANRGFTADAAAARLLRAFGGQP